MVEPLADQMVELSRKVLTFLFSPVTPARKKRGRKTDPQTPVFRRAQTAVAARQ